MSEGQVGFCGVRGVVDGKLYLLVYGKVMAGHIDPIEKKPVVHYKPGSKIFSIATSGCSWNCSYCQNSDISQLRKIEGVDATPSEIVDSAASHGCDVIAYTYNQPTIFMEYARDVGKLAHSRGLFNIFVSNGYDTPESVKMMDFPWTPVETLERHVSIGRKAGLNYVYIGNVPGHPDESTYCPGCRKLLIGRYGYDITSYSLDSNNRCDSCGYQTPIVGPLSKSAGGERFLSVIS